MSPRRLRADVALDAGWAGVSADIDLDAGAACEVMINGRWIGRTTADLPLRAAIAPGVLVEGSNRIALRLAAGEAPSRLHLVRSGAVASIDAVWTMGCD